MCFRLPLDRLHGAIEYCDDGGNDAEGQGHRGGRDQGKGITSVPLSSGGAPADISARYWERIAKV